MSSALQAARDYLQAVPGAGSVPALVLAALVAEIDGAPVVKVRGRVGEMATICVSHDFVGRRVRMVVDP